MKQLLLTVSFVAIPLVVEAWVSFFQTHHAQPGASQTTIENDINAPQIAAPAWDKVRDEQSVVLLQVYAQNRQKQNDVLQENHQAKTVPSAGLEAKIPADVSWTSPGQDELLGARSLLDSQSHVATDIASKLEEFKANVEKSGANHLQNLTETKASYEVVLHEQRENTTFLRETNKQIEAEITALKATNAQLRQHAEVLKKQSANLRGEIMAVESNLTLAQEFANRPLLTSSDDDLRFLQSLAKNESDLIKKNAHDSALASFVKRTSLLQVKEDINPVDAVQNLRNTLRKLTLEVKASGWSLEQEFKEHFEKEAKVQYTLLNEQRVLLAEEEKQLDLRSKLGGVVEHATTMTKYLTNKINRLRLYALRLSGPNS